MYIKPKKNLGQNFLVDKNIQKKIIRLCNLTNQDIVLEIGAGRGEFTGFLAEAVKKVYALEVDQRMYLQLDQNLARFNNAQVIKGDVLKFDINKFFKENKIKQKIKVIGNIPYYITSPIIEHLINYRDNISEVFITVQKEFGRRVIACPGSKEYGSFSCFVQYYAQSEILFEIKNKCFKPVPKVSSCLLSLKFRKRPLVEVRDEAMFFMLIRTAFNQRRKTLRNSLKDFIPLDRLESFFDCDGIDRNIRPEALSLEQFAKLMEKIRKNQKRT